MPILTGNYLCSLSENKVFFPWRKKFACGWRHKKCVYLETPHCNLMGVGISLLCTPIVPCRSYSILPTCAHHGAPWLTVLAQLCNCGMSQKMKPSWGLNPQRWTGPWGNKTTLPTRSSSSLSESKYLRLGTLCSQWKIKISHSNEIYFVNIQFPIRNWFWWTFLFYQTLLWRQMHICPECWTPWQRIVL